MEKTIINLRSALIGETTASAKYAAFSKKAKAEGNLKISLMFEAISRSESIHAMNHKRALEFLLKDTVEVEPEEFEIKSTLDNLQDAINGEGYEVSTMYPEFIEVATNEDVKRARSTFSYAFETEKKHKILFENALNEMKKNNESILASTYYICPVCGYTYTESDVKDACEICNTKKEKFIIFQ